MRVLVTALLKSLPGWSNVLVLVGFVFVLYSVLAVQLL